jgi:hypothetical protein
VKAWASPHGFLSIGQNCLRNSEGLMGRTGINVLALSLGLFTLGIFVWYRSAPRVLLAGLLYLAAANCLCLIAASRSRQKVLDLRAPALVLSGWQLAAIGVLNIRSFAYPEPQGFVLSYALTASAIGLAYSIVALADSSEQDGGYVPVSYFGRPRSRRMLFTAFISAPIGLLVIADLVIWSTWPWKPMPFEPPRLCLMLVSLTSIMVFLLVSGRYRNSLPSKRLLSQIAALTCVGLICIAGVQLILDYSAYNYFLSAIAATCIAGTTYWLSLARLSAPFPTQPGTPGSRPFFGS